jgi:hypothetical protein
MSPLVKNAVLAFVAAAVTAISAVLAVTKDDDLGNPAVLKAIGLAGIYAGGRALVGYLKAKFGDAPFAVDTEAPVGE